MPGRKLKQVEKREGNKVHDLLKEQGYQMPLSNCHVGQWLSGKEDSQVYVYSISMLSFKKEAWWVGNERVVGKSYGIYGHF